MTSQAGISHGAFAVFLGRLLAKGFTGMLKQQDELNARSQGASLSEASGKDLDDQLNEMTVAELREVAAERDVAGRFNSCGTYPLSVDRQGHGLFLDTA